MAKHEYYVVQGKTLDNVAETMKTVLGVDKDTPIRFDEITNNEKVEQVTESVDVQAEVIEQIKAALNGKSSIGVKEIMDIIDQSGVLDSTEGTATEKVEQLIDKAQWEKFWYEQSGTWTNQLSSLFVGSEKIPRLNFENCTVFRSCLKGNNAERIDYYINCGKATDINRALQDCKKLKFLYGIDGSNAKIWSYTFNGCILLETIQEPLNFQSATSTDGVFQGCNALKDIRFVPETIKKSITIPSPVLSDESIQSIIDGLATVETAQTLTLHKDVKAKLTEEQLTTITGKNWNLA